MLRTLSKEYAEVESKGKQNKRAMNLEPEVMLGWVATPQVTHTREGLGSKVRTSI